MTIKLYNTLSQETEDIKTIKENEVYMYHCGPTVYDYLHIGNMRAYIFADTIRRTFEYNGYKVKQVINITDVGHLVSDGNDGEDKMEKAANKTGKNAKDISDFFTDTFFNDLKKVNINTKNTIFPKATEHIQEQIELIQKLESEGHTYKTSDGIYFDVSTYKEYGKLGNIDLKGLEAGFRVNLSNEKHTPYDFALWKFSNTNLDTKNKRQQEWDSPWGVGFPGWHIECSAMSQKYLGENFDIHTGGIDHIPVHHNNEIAQSECANHKPLANIWMHSAFLNWKDKKMSKSDGTFITVSDLENKNINPLSFRYFLLQTKYRQPIFFELENLEASQVALNRLKARIKEIFKNQNNKDNNLDIDSIEGIKNNISDIINNDLDTPKLIAYLWDLVKDNNINQDIINIFDSILGLKLTEIENIEIPNNVLQLIEERKLARKNKDWLKSDEIREKIKNLGFDILDKSNEETEIVKM